MDYSKESDARMEAHNARYEAAMEKHDRARLKHWCMVCGKECGLIAESVDYSGTHCTGGNSGTHHTGTHVSSCCLEDWTTDEEEAK